MRVWRALTRGPPSSDHQNKQTLTVTLRTHGVSEERHAASVARVYYLISFVYIYRTPAERSSVAV